MRPVPFVLAPVTDITGTGPRWKALSAEPWFELKASRSLAGRWIRMHWSTGLLDPVSRPVVRCQLDEGSHDLFLPGAPFGRNEFIGFIPAKCKSIRISPVGQPGSFGFRIDEIDALSPIEVHRIGSKQAPFTALHALGAHMIGRPRDGRALMRDALGQTPLRFYGAWRQNGTRSYDAAGIDGKISQAARKIHIRFVILGAYRDLLTDVKSQNHANLSAVSLDPEHKAGAKRKGDPDHTAFRVTHPSEAMNKLITDLKDNDLVAIIPTGSRIPTMAAAMAAEAAARHPKADLLIGDEDHFGPNGSYGNPIFRPGFDRLLGRQRNQIGWATFARVGSLREAILREPELQAGKAIQAINSQAVISLSRVLLSLEKGTPAPWSDTIKPKGANARHAPNAGLSTNVSVLKVSAARIPVPSPAPEATIIIPTRDRLKLLKPCIDSILEKTKGTYRIIVVDNDSAQKATIAYFDSLRQHALISVVAVPGPFNFSRLCNEAARRAEGRVLVFLNNDTAVIRPDWLETLTALASDPAIGAVGAKLLYPSGKVQHAGVVVGLGGRAGHFEHGTARNDPGYFQRSMVPHQVSAVTGACLAVERSKFERVGGFDAEHLPVDLNDIDLCLRLAEAGHQTVMAPDCLLYHYESASRGHPRDSDRVYSKERAYFSARWLPVLRADPHFSPSLSLYASRASLG